MDQRAYWNGDAAVTWASQSEALDVVLEPIGRAALDALDPRPGERVLDVGCGAGATSRALAARVGERGAVLGVDLSEPMLAVARSRAGGPRYLHADVAEAAIPDAPYDAAFSRFGVMFFDDPRAAFARVRGALRPGGRLAFVCWRALEENAWARETLRAALGVLGELPEPSPPGAPGPFAFADGARVRAILEGAGFTDVDVRPLDPDYVLGATPERAASLAVRVGPVGRLVRERGLDPAPLRAALERLCAEHVGARGVSFAAACWVVTGRA
jgi:SAM-dependent methyltransferase